MIDISIRLNMNDVKRISAALLRVVQVVQKEKHELPFKCATDYVNLLRQNIMTQKFAGRYVPYHPRYANWKAQYFASTGYLVMRGEMVKNLTVFRDRGYKNRWYGGLPPNLPSVPGSSWFGPPGTGKAKSINMYAWLNEFGGVKSPERPVFVPTKEEYLERGIERRLKETKNAIARAWR